MKALKHNCTWYIVELPKEKKTVRCKWMFTWYIVELPKEKKTVRCKWMFTVKCKTDGSVERYKARLVAKGLTQIYGVDYQETFAPFAKINSIRISLSIAVNFDTPLYQFDVKNVFLNGELEEEVFMDLPPGFNVGLGIDKVCKLKRSLYGLKQPPRSWFERFKKAVTSYGFSQSQDNHTIFYKYTRNDKVVVLIVYVDDIILVGSDETGLVFVKKKLAYDFQIKDLETLKYFLGMSLPDPKMSFLSTKGSIFLIC
ncbi:cysteine-rich RLK RECEPTOR-like protein kinase [Cucumis melo var. makuwa]|uniref:Cysteine-rich RLK RECEPTOR-like protein kinase n=1 Tax=Cucumis melo var. makuwa TaxID=1194695 RepID=A0A5D3CU02_CUCMM|nr:cysteine-rich RLK RECEPTOR-like protein kinase [Cucumis melo var. makuwa]